MFTASMPDSVVGKRIHRRNELLSSIIYVQCNCNLEMLIYLLIFSFSQWDHWKVCSVKIRITSSSFKYKFHQVFESKESVTSCSYKPPKLSSIVFSKTVKDILKVYRCFLATYFTTGSYFIYQCSTFRSSDCENASTSPHRCEFIDIYEDAVLLLSKMSCHDVLRSSVEMKFLHFKSLQSWENWNIFITSIAALKVYAWLVNNQALMQLLLIHFN